MGQCPHGGGPKACFHFYGAIRKTAVTFVNSQACTQHVSVPSFHQKTEIHSSSVVFKTYSKRL